MRAGVARVALAAGLLVGAACGASDRVDLRAVAPSTTTTTAVLRGDAIRYVPRPVPPTRASRSSRVGGRGAEGVHSRAAAMRQPTTGAVWTRLAWCESRMRNLRNHPYSGYFQFTRPTWQSLGYGGEAADHDYGTQLAAAQRLLARSGPGQWPVCSRKVGL